MSFCPFLLKAVALDALSMEQQLPPYPFFTQTSAQQQQQTQVASALPPNASLMQTSGLQRGVQLPPLSVSIPSTIPQSPPGSQTQTSMGIDINSVSLMGKSGDLQLPRLLRQLAQEIRRGLVRKLPASRKGSGLGTLRLQLETAEKYGGWFAISPP